MSARRYSNASDPRMVVYASHADDRLGVVINWAHAAPRIWWRLWPQLLVVDVFLAVCLLAGLCCGQRRMWLAYIVFFPLAMLGRLIWRRRATKELARHPGPRGPRTADGLGAADDLLTADEERRRAWRGLTAFFVFVGLSLFVAHISRGVAWNKALLAATVATGLFASAAVFVLSLLPFFRNGVRVALSSAAFGGFLACGIALPSLFGNAPWALYGVVSYLPEPSDLPAGFAFAERLREEGGDFVVDTPFELEIGSTRYAKQLAGRMSGEKDADGSWRGYYSCSVRMSSPYFGVEKLLLVFKVREGALHQVMLCAHDPFVGGKTALSLPQCRVKVNEVSMDITRRLGVRFGLPAVDMSFEEAVRWADDAGKGRREKGDASRPVMSREFLVREGRMRVGEKVLAYRVAGNINDDKTCFVSLSIYRPGS